MMLCVVDCIIFVFGTLGGINVVCSWRKVGAYYMIRSYTSTNYILARGNEI
jgi:hypothetical protein